MSVTAANPTYQPTAPTKSGQVIVSKPGDDSRAYVGKAVLTLDGTATTTSVNWIDGTQTLPFTPGQVLCGVQYGTTGTPAGLVAVPYSITATGFSVKLSAAGTSADAPTLNFLVLK